MSVFKRVSGFAAAALTALSLSTADATIIGQASYLGTAGDVFNPGAANLEMQLDGVGIFNVPGTGVFNLATDSPTAFASLSAVLQDGVENDITFTGFTGHTFTPSVTVTDFNYSFPKATDDLPDAATILDIIVTVNFFDTATVFVPSFGNVEVSIFDVLVEIQAVPVPAGSVFAATGIAGFIAVGYFSRRRR